VQEETSFGVHSASRSACASSMAGWPLSSYLGSSCMYRRTRAYVPIGIETLHVSFTHKPGGETLDGPMACVVRRKGSMTVVGQIEGGTGLGTTSRR